jgi:hypothetical protein
MVIYIGWPILMFYNKEKIPNKYYVDKWQLMIG